MPLKTDSLSSARAPPNRPFMPTFLPCLIDSAAAPMGHAEISISSRVFPLRLEIMRIALGSDSQCPPSSQPFIPFFRLTGPPRPRTSREQRFWDREINRSY